MTIKPRQSSSGVFCRLYKNMSSRGTSIQMMLIDNIKSAEEIEQCKNCPSWIGPWFYVDDDQVKLMKETFD